MIKKIFGLLLLVLITVSKLDAVVKFPITIQDDKTINMAFVDEDGDDFSLSGYYFEAYLKDNRSDTDANADVTITSANFTVSGNDASFVLTSAQNNRSEGVDYLDVRMYDASGNRTKVFFANVSYILAESGSSTALSTTIGSTDLTVTIEHASGAIAVADVMTAKGDIIAGSASGAYVIVPVGTNGQFLKADSTVTAGVTWATASGAGDMLEATYDPAGIAEQLVGLTASQTLTNKTLTTPTLSVPVIADFTSATHDHSNNAGGGTLAHTDLSSIGTNTHAQIDTHISSSNIHFTEASIDHTAITNIGSNTHAQIDTHISSTANPHSVDETDVLPDQSGNSGKYLTTNGTATSWGAVAGGFSSFTVTGNSGTGQEITDGNTLYLFGGTGITAVVGATDTVTFNTVDGEIDHDSLLNFAAGEHFTQASITTVGTIGTGIWNGDALTDAYVTNDITIQTTSAMTGTNANFSGTVTVNSLIGTVGTATQATIDHDSLANFNSNEHFTEGSIDHTAITNIGSNSHSDIDTHISSANIHYTQANITAVGTISSGIWQGTAITDNYVANDLTISGGTIDNTPIGASTPGTGVFSSVTVNTQLKNVNLIIANDDILNVDTIQAAEQIYTDTTNTAPSTVNVTIDFNTGEAHSIDLESIGGGLALTLSNIVTGNSYVLELIQGATEREISSISPSVEWLDGTTVNVTATENASTVLGIWKAPSGAVKVNYADYY